MLNIHLKLLLGSLGIIELMYKLGVVKKSTAECEEGQPWTSIHRWQGTLPREKKICVQIKTQARQKLELLFLKGGWVLRPWGDSYILLLIQKVITSVLWGKALPSHKNFSIPHGVTKLKFWREVWNKCLVSVNVPCF